MTTININITALYAQRRNMCPRALEELHQRLRFATDISIGGCLNLLDPNDAPTSVEVWVEVATTEPTEHDNFYVDSRWVPVNFAHEMDGPWFTVVACWDGDYNQPIMRDAAGNVRYYA